MAGEGTIGSLLSRMVKAGDLTVKLPGGREVRAGDGSGPPVVVQVSRAGLRRLIGNPGLGLGEAYMEEDVVFEQGTLWDLLEIVGRSGARGPKGRGSWAKRTKRAAGRRLQQANDRTAARRNVAHHYDLSNDFYRRWLDADMQYSCAYFARADMTLDEAQAAKKRHIAAKLLLEPGHKVLDIGSGWGGLAMSLARDHGADVLGVTLSTEQIKLARERVEAAGLSERVRFEFTDYRDVEGPFDRIVSVGMLEHVGAPNLRRYFETVKRQLSDDGVAVIHTIGRMNPPALTHPFTRKYIFPGSFVPAMSEVSAAIEDAGLWVTDVEVLRLHYAETTRAWRERFMADPEIPNLYDGRFRRMWEFYLAAGELAFRYGTHMVMQFQLAKRVGVVPTTRDYLAGS
jgi:cyclopropane-fatty-acyl-phospholipid synthase